MGIVRDLFYAKRFGGGGGGGGGESSYKLLHSEEITVNTTSSSTTPVKTISLGAEAYTGDKALYVRIRDKAGPRAGYFYGSDSFAYSAAAANGSTFGDIFSNNALCMDSNGLWKTASFSVFSYGLFAQTLYGGDSSGAAGDITIVTRYSSTYGAIDGTYIVEVYLLDTPDGEPLFPHLD